MNEKPRRLLSIPNIITCFRLVLIPLFVLAFFERRYGWTIVCLVLSGISDVADGYIARRFNMVTELGKLLDPVADKMTQGAVLVCLAFRNPVIWIVFGLLAFKELVMSILGWIGIRRTGHMISAVWYGKACTAILYASMAVLVLFPGLPGAAVNIIVGVDAAAIAATLVLYGRWYARYLRESASNPPEEVRDPDEARATVSFAFSALIIVLLLVAAVVGLIYRDEIDIDAIINVTPENIWLAALVFMGLYAAKSLTTVVYVKLLYVAAGAVFPLPTAIAVGVVGTLVELMLPYLIGLGGGSRTADYLLERSPRLQKLRFIRTRSNFWFSAFVRAAGIFPTDPVSVYFGACRMPVWEFLFGGTLGLLPTLVIATVAGARISDPGSPGFIASAALFIVVQAGSAVAFIIWIRRHYPAGAPAQKEVDSGEPAQ